METTRRGFLQVAGLAGLGVMLAVPAVKILDGLQDSSTSSLTNELTAAGTKRLAMAIDITKCNKYKQENGGCNLCESACHLWHKVPNRFADPEEEIKWIWEDKYGKVFEEHLIENISEDDEALKGLRVKLLCNQCSQPTCVKYCPTRATWRRESDGIIMIDMHRCIGCRYCMAGCPYGARSFNWSNPRKFLDDLNDDERANEIADQNIDIELESVFPTRTRGVVEKCNFCADILEFDENGNATMGHEPKCVEICRKIGANALVFGDMLNENSDIYRLLKDHQLHLMQRFPELGNKPNNYYIITDNEE